MNESRNGLMYTMRIGLTRNLEAIAKQCRFWYVAAEQTNQQEKKLWNTIIKKKKQTISYVHIGLNLMQIMFVTVLMCEWTIKLFCYCFDCVYFDENRVHLLVTGYSNSIVRSTTKKKEKSMKKMNARVQIKTKHTHNHTNTLTHTNMHNHWIIWKILRLMLKAFFCKAQKSSFESITLKMCPTAHLPQNTADFPTLANFIFRMGFIVVWWIQAQLIC